ncbi:MAG: orotidine-5'-phosphate decarboxylase [Erysipelotrichaceae bacterium]
MRDVIIACDFSSKEETLAFLDQFQDVKPFVKIGMELYYAQGPSIVHEIKERGHKIFLDLKLHDIPNTVYKAMKNIGKLGVDMTNVHAQGTTSMMQMARQALDETNPETILLAVTQLTSTSNEQMKKDLLIDHELNDVVLHYAKNAKQANLQGVVCSPLEACMIHDNLPSDFISVTPGIRFSDSAKDDQQRITTPKRAREIGSSYIVVGRPITAAENPVEAYKRCVQEFVEGK